MLLQKEERFLVQSAVSSQFQSAVSLDDNESIQSTKPIPSWIWLIVIISFIIIGICLIISSCLIFQNTKKNLEINYTETKIVAKKRIIRI